MDNSKRPLLAHACILSANICWGLMSPIGKDAMLNGVDNLNLVFMRALGGGGLRGAVRHVRSLFAHAESPKHIAPHGGERLQLRATCGVGER